MLSQRFQTKCPSDSGSTAQKRAALVAGWLAVIMAVGTMSVLSFTIFSSQQSVAQQSRRAQTASSGNRGQRSYQVERQRLNRSIAVLKLGMKSQTKPATDFSSPGKSNPTASSQAPKRSLDDYMDAVSVVFSAIAPQRKPKKPIPAPPVKKLTMEETATRFL
jgi:hypothetical protein